MKLKVRQVGILLFWLFLWQVASLLIDNNIILVGPADVLASLFMQLFTGIFWKTCAFSLSHILLGFLTAFLSAVLLGSLSFCFPFVQELLTPVMLLFKSVPVAAFVILALIWMGSENLSVFIAYIVVLPIIYASTLSGLKSADRRLLEMAGIFRLSFYGKVKAVYWPALVPYLITGVNSALGMSIKSGVAAEVIGVPDFSIGEQLYMAKIYLSTADLFAWTLTIILFSWLFEKGFLLLLERLNPVSGAAMTTKPKIQSEEKEAHL